MKKIISLLILSFCFTNAYSESEAPGAKNSNIKPVPNATSALQVIVSGSGCPDKPKKPVELKIESDMAEVPLDYEIALSGPGLVRKTCQARVTIKGVPGHQYEIREVSQSLLFNVQKKSEMHAELSYGIVGQQDIKIDQDVKEAGEYRHILVKKLINYATPCGKDAMLRVQTDIQSKGGNNNFKADAVALTIEKRACSEPVQ